MGIVCHPAAYNSRRPCHYAVLNHSADVLVCNVDNRQNDLFNDANEIYAGLYVLLRSANVDKSFEMYLTQL